MAQAHPRGWAGLFAFTLVVAQLPVLSRAAFDPNQSDFANYFVPAFVLGRGRHPLRRRLGAPWRRPSRLLRSRHRRPQGERQHGDDEDGQARHDDFLTDWAGKGNCGRHGGPRCHRLC